MKYDLSSLKHRMMYNMAINLNFFYLICAKLGIHCNQDGKPFPNDARFCLINDLYIFVTEICFEFIDILQDYIGTMPSLGLF